MPKTYPRTFVPANLDTKSFAAIEPLFHSLESRQLHSPKDLERWLLDISELASVLSEEAAHRYSNMTCHTDDPAIEKIYLDWVENIQPLLKPHWQKLDQLFLASPHRKELPHPRYAIFDRNTASDVALFREENIPLQTEEAKLDQQYNKISGAMMIPFEGRDQTLPQMSRYLEEPDRAKRQSAWEAIAAARLQHVAEFNSLFDAQIKLRHQMAKNANLVTFVDYAFQMFRRFEYNPIDCFNFHAAVEETCVPVVHRLMQKRAAALKLDKLKPWDLSVDPFDRPALRPFETAEQLCNGVQRIIQKLDPTLGAQFQFMRDEKLLDLDSRKGKAPGGYQQTLDEIRAPFIFMNAAGMHDDVKVLLHEAGHAFHAIAAKEDPLLAYRSAPLEFAEVASMSMELITMDHWDEFYPAEKKGVRSSEHSRAMRHQLEGIIRLLPWIAQIDAFQFWIYTHPTHTHEERNNYWLELSARFGPGPLLDYTGHEQTKATNWQRQRHLWGNPFYYIEYGIAELGSLQLWSHYRKDPATALAAYRRALALGGSAPLPALFAAADIRFDFSSRTLGPLMELIEEELTQLPE